MAKSSKPDWTKLTAEIGRPSWRDAALDAIGDKVAGRHAELAGLAKHALALPAAVKDESWPDLVRALTSLTASYSELMEEQFGEVVSIEDEGDDESGTMEMIGEEKLSTIELALELLAIPEAIARDDWFDLFTFVCHEKHVRLGAWSFGDEEAKALLALPAVKKHDRVDEMTEAAQEAFPNAGID